MQKIARDKSPQLECFIFDIMLCMAGNESKSSRPVPSLEGRHWRKDSTALSNRESQVLKLLAQGRKRHEIAKDFGVSDIGSALRSLLDKLGAFSTTQAVFIGADRGLINPRQVLGELNPTTIAKLTPQECQLLEAMTENGGADCDCDEFAKENGITDIGEQIEQISDKLGGGGLLRAGLTYLAAKEAGIFNNGSGPEI